MKSDIFSTIFILNIHPHHLFLYNSEIVNNKLNKYWAHLKDFPNSFVLSPIFYKRKNQTYRDRDDRMTHIALSTNYKSYMPIKFDSNRIERKAISRLWDP